jgi:hypothetical protein
MRAELVSLRVITGRLAVFGSGWVPLDDSVWSGNGLHVGGAQPGCGQQMAVLGVGPFLAAGEDQHVQVAEQHWQGIGRVVGDESLDDEHPPMAGHGVAAGGQDLDRADVVPVVQHVGQDVAIGAVRDTVEEVAGNDLAAVFNAGGRSTAAASAATAGTSNKMPRRPGCARKMAASSVPLPPPMSATVRIGEKS